MRRFFWSVIAGVMVLSAPAVYGAPTYGTKMPEKNRIFTGTESYMLFKRDLRDGYGSLNSTQFFVLLSYGVTDWFSIDLKGGAGDIRQKPENGSKADYYTNFAGGYGFRVRLYADDRNKIVFGFQHISVHPRTAEVDGERNEAILDDWQWTLAGSHEFGRFTPYAGVRWSRVDYIHRVGDNDKKRRMSDLTKDIGLIVGGDVQLTKNMWLNIEGQFLDSQAAAVSLKYAF